jgi:general secretion pathway protein K
MKRKFLDVKSSGIVLITALWVLVILSLLSLSFAHQAKIEIKLAGHYKREAQLRQLTKAVVRAALRKLASDANDYDALNEIWRIYPAQPEDCLSEVMKNYPHQQTEIEYTIIDEESKLNINSASFESLLELPEVDEEIASSIIDWRDEDDEPLAFGAEDSYYQSLENPYPCKNTLFDLIGELLYVRGVTNELFYGSREGNIPLRDLLTVWGDGKININTAREEILLTIPGVREEIIESIIEKLAGPDGDDGTEDDEPFKSIESLKEIPTITISEYEKLKSHCKVASSYFTIQAQSSLKKSNLRKRITTVLKRKDNSFIILMWKES